MSKMRALLAELRRRGRVKSVMAERVSDDLWDVSIYFDDDTMNGLFISDTLLSSESPQRVADMVTSNKEASRDS